MLDNEFTVYITAYRDFAEAMDFRNWCESECVRLIGSKGIAI